MARPALRSSARNEVGASFLEVLLKSSIFFLSKSIIFERDKMELSNFVKTAIVEIQNGVDEAEKELEREVELAINSGDKKTIHFSVSVVAGESAGESDCGKGEIGGGIKVLGISVGGEGQYEKIKTEINNKTEASSISFDVYVSTKTKKKEEKDREELIKHNKKYSR